MRKAFTLIELLICIAVIGLLIMMLLPAISAVREAARIVSCKNSLHQISIGIHHYEMIHKHLPVRYVDERSLLNVNCPSGINYAQMYDKIDPVTYIQLVEERQKPSNEIELLTETSMSHQTVVNTLYLDGHVESKGIQ